tara:strand:+ start:314 stop:655 length:342 start_codon:yes stop_codon:yes gene_type:complete
MNTYKIKKIENYDKDDFDYHNGIPPLIKWWMYNYKGHFINTYHTPHKAGFDRYVDKDQFINFKNYLNMNQKELSEFLGISVRTISRIETGNPIGAGVLRKLDKVLGEAKWTWS